MGNFDFIASEYPGFHESAARAETYLYSDPGSAVMQSRKAAEQLVDDIYAAYDLQLPYGTSPTQFNRLSGAGFIALASPTIREKFDLIRKVGNDAVHSNRKITTAAALAVLREVFHVAVWAGLHHSRHPEKVPTGAQFDENLAKQSAPLSKAEIAELYDYVQNTEKRREDELQRQKQLHADELAKIETERQELLAQIEAAKAAATPDTHDYREDETRTHLIDLYLGEAGWPLDQTADREYEVTGMPNPEGKGWADYVLWGDDGLPLAVIEAKRASRSPHDGQQQARLYADCLEKMFGRRPVIFYTNGYEHWIWDDASGYPPRETQGFYRKDELEWLHAQRNKRRPLAGVKPNPAIVDRYYQERAIKAIGDTFDKRKREALLVMATGTGKTRTVVALTDVLQKYGWAKRILFLADRQELVKQATGAFKEHLPDSATINLLVDKDPSARVYVSTYQTMMGQLDRIENGQRVFGPGYFDLIVVDEAHRSIYAKYGAIFDYFDALLVGLTATPKDDVSHNTYRLFGLEDGDPTDEYSLDQGVADTYLVPPRGLDYSLKFLREGVDYDALSEEDKDAYDATDWGEDGPPEHIYPEELNRFLFNADTVDKVLQRLMEEGLKVAGGDRLGKTIIFAKNQKHANYIEERFNAGWPEYGGQFARVITHGAPYAHTLIDDFKEPEKAPHIAISVDMLDTGIDVPEVLNLVFFKLVRSKSKFWQMIGRGTRLSEDLFGPGHDKDHFLVLDFCQNLVFFNQNLPSPEGSLPKSLSQRLFENRLALVLALDKQAPSNSDSGSSLRALRSDVADELHQVVAGMNPDNVIVRTRRRIVERFQDAESWKDLKEADAEEALELSNLPTSYKDSDEDAKRFDLLMLRRQLAQLEGDADTAEKIREAVQDVAAQLLTKTSIPSVAEQAVLIESVSEDEWWVDVPLEMIELARIRLRGLVRLIEKARRDPVYTDFVDTVGEVTEVVLPGISPGVDYERFERRVKAYLREHDSNVALQKLRRNQPLTDTDLEALEEMVRSAGGGAEEIEAGVEKTGSLGLFIRSLVGLDRAAVVAEFEEFIDRETLTAEQIRFIETIIDELSTEGVMAPERLFQTPYTDLGTDHIFADDIVTEFAKKLADFNAGAEPEKSA